MANHYNAIYGIVLALSLVLVLMAVLAISTGCEIRYILIVGLMFGSLSAIGNTQLFQYC
jgi:hypothetical protein